MKRSLSIGTTEESATLLHTRRQTMQRRAGRDRGLRKDSASNDARSKARSRPANSMARTAPRPGLETDVRHGKLKQGSGNLGLDPANSDAESKARLRRTQIQAHAAFHHVQRACYGLDVDCEQFRGSTCRNNEMLGARRKGEQDANWAESSQGAWNSGEGARPGAAAGAVGENSTGVGHTARGSATTTRPGKIRRGWGDGRAEEVPRAGRCSMSRRLSRQRKARRARLGERRRS